MVTEKQERRWFTVIRNEGSLQRGHWYLVFIKFLLNSLTFQHGNEKKKKKKFGYLMKISYQNVHLFIKKKNVNDNA